MESTATVRVHVDPEQALAAYEQMRAAAAAVRTELAPTPGFQTSEGKLTALRQAAYAILAVLGLFGVHAGSATGTIDKWLPVAAFAAAVVDGAIYTWHRSGLKAAVAATVGALVAVPAPVPVGDPVAPVPSDPGTPADAVPDRNVSGAADVDEPPIPPRPTPAQSAARARRAAREGREKRTTRK
jgi:hypothetical protein